MQIKPNGSFLVKPNEIVTVTLTASDTKYLAAISPLSFGNWIVSSPPNVSPNPLTEIREFVMVAPTTSFAVTCGFLPPPGTAPAGYHVKIEGNDPADVPFDDDILYPNSPMPSIRHYTFETS